MPSVRFTTHLKRFYPGLDKVELSCVALPEILDELNQRFPKLKDYIVDEHGRLRKHVNIFIGDELIHDRIKLSDKINPSDELYIMQALSGG